MLTPLGKQHQIKNEELVPIENQQNVSIHYQQVCWPSYASQSLHHHAVTEAHDVSENEDQKLKSENAVSPASVIPVSKTKCRF